jgi:hypothetical protein
MAQEWGESKREDSPPIGDVNELVQEIGQESRFPKRKGRHESRPPKTNQPGSLKAVYETGVHAHVVLVGKAVKLQNHPVELNRAENQLVLSEV